jgi:leucyl-tRNA synthetase
MVYCEEDGWVPVKESDLPVLLPDVASYEPTEDGESPLANITEWVNTTCPKCGKPAKRETDTMPNWAGSSWYFLRYMDAHNKEAFASKEALNYWGKVDLYNGGMEHVTRHLLYARFWNQFLYNIGLVPNKEPFLKRVAHGMILGADGEKMAKSRPEYCVDPIDTINEYGADALRTYEMFIGDYEKDSVWSDNGLKGCKKFLDRIYRMKDKLVSDNNYSKELENIIHKTIKKVTNDMLSMKFNTAVSALMILVNEYDKMDNITSGDYKVLLTLLNPMAPHMTEELNEECKLGDILAYTAWPTYYETKTIDEVIEIGVQVNGKLRGSIKINLNEEEDSVKEKALNEPNVNKYLLNNEVVKIIVVKNRIVNIIIK